MVKILSAADAVALIEDGMTVGVSGFGSWAGPGDLLVAMGERYREKNTPPRTSRLYPALRRAICRRMATG